MRAESPSEAKVYRISGAEGDEPAATEEPKNVAEQGDTQNSVDVDVQAQLDEERAARIQLQRERDEAAERMQEAAREYADESDRVVQERDSYKQKYEKLKDLMSTSYIDNAIMRQTKFDFHDTEAVRAFLDQSKIRLDLDTGKIDGLDEQLRKIAKERPYLVRQPESQSAPNNFTPPPGPSTGSHPYGGTVSQKETDKRKLGSKYRIPGYGSMTARSI